MGKDTGTIGACFRDTNNLMQFIQVGVFYIMESLRNQFIYWQFRDSWKYASLPNDCMKENGI